MAWAVPTALPLEVAPTGSRLARVHREGTVEPFFGPKKSEPPTHRFHDPRGRFKVCFLGENATASFVETFLRDPPVRLVTRAELERRRLTHFLLGRDLHLVSLYGSGLAHLGCTAEMTSSPPPYVQPQALARALWEHADRPDGIRYLCRHDNTLFAFALFDRARDALEVLSPEGLAANRDRLLDWSRRYRFAIG